MRYLIADALVALASRLITWSNDIRLGDWRRRRQQVAP